MAKPEEKTTLTASHCIPLLAGWATLQRELQLSCGLAPSGPLQTVPWELWDRQVKNIRQDWMTFSKRAGEFSLHGPQGTGLGEEIDLHLMSCK